MIYLCIFLSQVAIAKSQQMAAMDMFSSSESWMNENICKQWLLGMLAIVLAGRTISIGPYNINPLYKLVVALAFSG